MEIAQLQVTRAMSEYGTVVVLMGGVSAEREISLETGRAVLASLERSGVDAVGIDVGEPIEAFISDLRQADRAFIALHGSGGEDGSMQGLLQCLGIPYTGSCVLSSALAMDKIKTKQIWQSCGINTPKSWILEGVNAIGSFVKRFSQNELSFPIIVKPIGEGSSLGMNKVDCLSFLSEALTHAFSYGSVVLAEPFLPGPEYTVGIVQDVPLPVIKIKTQRQFYDYQAKYVDDDTEFLLPSGLDPEEELGLQQAALETFKSLGCSGWGRVDLLKDERGAFCFIEVNTVPGLTKHSLVPKASAQAGLSFDALVLSILETSMSICNTVGSVKCS